MNLFLVLQIGFTLHYITTNLKRINMNEDSIYYERYYDHILDRNKQEGALGKVFDIINDISDRRGIGNEFEAIDTDIQDDMITNWVEIVKD